MQGDTTAGETGRGAGRANRVITGLVLVVLGAVAGVLAMSQLSWFRSGVGEIVTGDSSADGLRSQLRFFQQIIDTRLPKVSLGISLTYFSWLGWTLFTVTALLAIITAALTGRAGKIVAAGAVAVALGGVVTTMLAIQLVHYPASLVQHTGGGVPGYADFLGATGIGTWLMLLAYVLLGAGAVLVRGARQQIQRQFAARPEEPPAAADQAPYPPDDAPPGVAPPQDDASADGATAEGVTAHAEQVAGEPRGKEPVEDW